MSSSSKAQIHVIVYAKAVTFYVRHKTAKTLQTPLFYDTDSRKGAISKSNFVVFILLKHQGLFCIIKIQI